MEKHPLNFFPEMNKEYSGKLEADIKANGFDKNYPIILYEGKILDGWNRYNACKRLGIEPPYQTFQSDKLDALKYVLRSNNRRDLTSSQRAAIAAEADEMVKAIQQQIEVERRRKQAETLTNTHAGVSDKKLTQTKPERSSQKIADTFNTNRTYITEAQKLRTENPEIFEQIKSGQKTISEVQKEEKKRQREEEIQRQREDIESGKAQLPDGVFEVVVIDPPWAYGRGYDPDGSRVANPYPEMTQSELLELNPPFAKDSVLFLWTTHAFIWDAKELMNEWGFTYKAILVWNKEKIGMGAWLRMQCEFCLIGIKGKPTWDNTKWRDIITEPRREHSRKPDMFYEMVNDITVGRKLDYFSREARQGWEVFGNDVQKF